MHAIWGFFLFFCFFLLRKLLLNFRVKYLLGMFPNENLKFQVKLTHSTIEVGRITNYFSKCFLGKVVINDYDIEKMRHFSIYTYPLICFKCTTKIIYFYPYTCLNYSTRILITSLQATRERNSKKKIKKILLRRGHTSKAWLTLKSPIFTLPEAVTKRLSGLISPCIIFCSRQERT